MTHLSLKALGQSMVLCALLFQTACAVNGRSPAAHVDDTVSADYVCRLEDGSLVATTVADVAVSSDTSLSPLFYPRGVYKPAEIVVKPSSGVHAPALSESVEAVIEEKLAFHLAGVTAGNRRAIELEIPPDPRRAGRERFISLNRRRTVYKSQQVAENRFRYLYGTMPEKGLEFDYRSGFKGRIEDAEAGVIRYQVRAIDTMRFATPFGPARIVEKDDYYNVLIDATVGSLVRSGPLVGKIVEVDERQFTLDYGHPFGFEPLQCELAVRKVNPETMEGIPSKGADD